MYTVLRMWLLGQHLNQLATNFNKYLNDCSLALKEQRKRQSPQVFNTNGHAAVELWRNKPRKGKNHRSRVKAH
jgi:hypothetical protein